MKMDNSLQERSASLDFVNMPWEDKTQITILKDGCSEIVISRWELIEKELNLYKSISDVNELINVINSYNGLHEKEGRQIQVPWKCLVLRKYFANLEINDVTNFFKEDGILSTIRTLALQLKDLVPKLQILKAGYSSFVKLHQLQIASLLANAFLCTFPKGKPNCPTFNFNTLYESNSGTILNYNVEKIKCLIHYFSRIHKKQPTGHLSFHRLCIPDHEFPRWDKTTAELTSLVVQVNGKIEDQDGFLQMDFANQFIGGGVLGRGCVQEEIRFIICPELLAARLFTEGFSDNEAMFIIGAERYCQYSGYSSTFKFAGDYQDITQYDEHGHKKSFLIVLDALYFNHYSEQFRESKILRELKKAYVGFKPHVEPKSIPLATGNWGCGAFGGDPQLKSILQLMASSQAQRNMLYLTFGDTTLKTQIEEMYHILQEKRVNVGMLYRIIRLYNREKKNNQRIFDFIKESLKKLDKKKLIITSGPVLTPNAQSTYDADLLQKDCEIEEKAMSESKCQAITKRPDDDLNFAFMKIDFDTLDAEIQNEFLQLRKQQHSLLSSLESSSRENASLDKIWFENEVVSSKRICEDQRNTQEKMDTSDYSCNPLSDKDKTTDYQSREFNSDKSQECVVTTKNQLSAFRGRRPNNQNKKFVQKKITDCFLKK